MEIRHRGNPLAVIPGGDNLKYRNFPIRIREFEGNNLISLMG